MTESKILMDNRHGISTDDNHDAASLSQLFDNAFAMFNNINRAKEPTNSPEVQSDIRRTVNMLENATRLVSLVGMFSNNEIFEEVATEHIKYFLLPALLGSLTTKICGLDDRMHIVNVSEIYFLDFLKRAKAYGLTDICIPENKTEITNDTSATINNVTRQKSEAELLTEMVFHRNTKLQRYREQKELELKLKTLSENLSNPNIDDEVKREYFITLVKLYVSLTIEEISSIAAEKPILEHMKTLGETKKSDHIPKFKSNSSKLQPIIITKNELQKQVFGAGYPSLPVLTVQEFYDQRIKDGDWPDPSQRNQINSKCLQNMGGSSSNAEDSEVLEKEEKIEADDPDYLEQLRAMDEYKDTHRRGWGNRANRS